MLSLDPFSLLMTMVRAAEIDIVPPQITSLADAQTVAVDDEADEPIPLAMTIALEHGEELLNLRLRQVLAHPILRRLACALVA